MRVYKVEVTFEAEVSAENAAHAYRFAKALRILPPAIEFLRSLRSRFNRERAYLWSKREVSRVSVKVVKWGD